MHWRAPWLRDAREPGLLAGVDALCIVASYNYVSWQKIGYWPGINRGVIVIIFAWTIISYGLGRYSIASDSEEIAGSARKLIVALVPSIAIISLFAVHSWLYQIVDAQTRFRGFLLPLFTITTVLSLGLRSMLNTDRRRTKKWIVIGSEREISAVQKELRNEPGSILDSVVLFRGEDWKSAYNRLESIDGLAIGATNDQDKELEAALLDIRAKGVSVTPVVNWCENNLKRIPPELISAEWLVRAEGFSLRPGNATWRVKRLFDVIGATLLLMVTGAIIIISAVLVWAEDRGPVFYRQIRTGLYGKHITIWKLRSMRVNSEKDGAQWASASDPRITKVGRVIRATRIDELPQLIGVIRGELSLIGPRPERPEIENGLEKEIDHYRVRHWVRPGLSGWAQVCYPYGASVEDSRMKLSYDIYYLRNAGLLLDLLIAIRTVKLVINREGYRPEARKSSAIER